MIRRFAFLGIVSICVACASTPPSHAPASTEPPTAPAPTASDDSPTPEPAEPEASSPTLEAIGIAACDEYLAAYQKCETQLGPDIQAGNRRSYQAEKGWLQFMKTQPDGANLESACRSMQTDLEKSCP